MYLEVCKFFKMYYAYKLQLLVSCSYSWLLYANGSGNYDTFDKDSSRDLVAQVYFFTSSPYV